MMARQRRRLTGIEHTRPCSFCGAQPGERCTNPSGSLYLGVHAARSGTGRRTRPPQQRDPGELYPVPLCGHCHHPGGQHITGKGCRLCRGCPGWDEENHYRGWWSDKMTDELLATMEDGDDG